MLPFGPADLQFHCKQVPAQRVSTMASWGAEATPLPLPMTTHIAAATSRTAVSQGERTSLLRPVATDLEAETTTQQLARRCSTLSLATNHNRSERVAIFVAALLIAFACLAFSLHQFGSPSDGGLGFKTSSPPTTTDPDLENLEDLDLDADQEGLWGEAKEVEATLVGKRRGYVAKDIRHAEKELKSAENSELAATKQTTEAELLLQKATQPGGKTEDLAAAVNAAEASLRDQEKGEPTSMDASAALLQTMQQTIRNKPEVHYAHHEIQLLNQQGRGKLVRQVKGANHKLRTAFTEQKSAAELTKEAEQDLLKASQTENAQDAAKAEEAAELALTEATAEQKDSTLLSKKATSALFKTLQAATQKTATDNQKKIKAPRTVAELIAAGAAEKKAAEAAENVLNGQGKGALAKKVQHAENMLEKAHSEQADAENQTKMASKALWNVTHAQVRDPAAVKKAAQDVATSLEAARKEQIEGDRLAHFATSDLKSAMEEATKAVIHKGGAHRPQQHASAQKVANMARFTENQLKRKGLGGLAKKLGYAEATLKDAASERQDALMQTKKAKQALLKASVPQGIRTAAGTEAVAKETQAAKAALTKAAAEQKDSEHEAKEATVAVMKVMQSAANATGKSRIYSKSKIY